MPRLQRSPARLFQLFHRSSRCLLAATLAALTAAAANAATITLQHDDTIAKDVFVYEFLSSTNMDNYVLGGANFGKLLGTVNTGGGGHDVKSLLQFDLTGTSLLYASQVQSATLKLRVIDANAVGFPVANSSAAFPVTVSAFSLASGWNEQTVNWLTQPATTGAALASAVVNGINQTISFNLTDAVKSWVNSPAANQGIQLTQLAETRNNQGIAVGAVFASSAFGSHQPLLEIQLKPELPGDANFDGVVDVADYTIWADNYLQSPRVFAQGDFNHDGLVDNADYTIWADNYSPFGGLNAAAVPEPATLGLLIGGLPAMAAAIWSRRRAYTNRAAEFC